MALVTHDDGPGSGVNLGLEEDTLFTIDVANGHTQHRIVSTAAEEHAAASGSGTVSPCVGQWAYGLRANLVAMAGAYRLWLRCSTWSRSWSSSDSS